MYCPKLERVVKVLAEKHGLDLSDDEASVTLEMKGFLPLHLEVHGDRILVGHHYLMNGDMVPDPMIYLWRTPGGLVPCHFNNLFGTTYLTHEGGNGELTINNQADLDDIVEYAEDWADTLRGRYIDSDLAVAVVDEED